MEQKGAYASTQASLAFMNFRQIIVTVFGDIIAFSCNYDVVIGEYSFGENLSSFSATLFVVSVNRPLATVTLLVLLADRTATQ